MKVDLKEAIISLWRYVLLQIVLESKKKNKIGKHKFFFWKKREHKIGRQEKKSRSTDETHKACERG